MSFKLRPYQEEAIKALWNYWAQTPNGRPILVLPTGSGKSAQIAAIIERIISKRPEFRFLVLTHVKEIVDQNAKEFKKFLPNENVGIYSAGLASKTIRRVTFAGIQSIYKKAQQIGKIDFVVIDEVHLVSPDTDSMYQKFLKELQQENPNIKLLGTTGTPMRMDQGSLISEGSIFTDIVYDVPIRNLITWGYLCPLISKPKESVDLTNVKMSGFDFNSVDLEIAFAKDQLITKHCEEIIKNGEGRKSWLIFCSGINHAKLVSEKFQSLGVSSDYITGEMVAFERDKKIEDFKNGKIRALCNVNVLTTGFNYPGVDLVGLLRATKSASLYIQMVGRGSRTCANKSNCLVLDYGNNIETHGPVDLIQIKKGKSNKAEVGKLPSKKCGDCGAVVGIKTKSCPACGYEFPESSFILEVKPSEKAILSEIETYKVKGFRVLIHEKPDKPQMIKVQYYTDGGAFTDYLCFNHGGYSSQMARKKWVEKGGIVPAPSCTETAYERQDELKEPDTISVIKNGKYYEVLKLTFSDKKEENLEEIEGDLVNI